MGRSAIREEFIYIFSSADRILFHAASESARRKSTTREACSSLILRLCPLIAGCGPRGEHPQHITVIWSHIAFRWTVGPSWPHGGEIDVLEGVHKVNTNKMTLHTDAGCVVDHTKQMQGKVDRTDCKSGKDNQGCGVLDSDPTSYGDGFNKAGGGVYAHRWTNSEIDIWHFTRKDVPEDIKSGAPDPSQWPVPTGSFVAGPGCDFTQHFKDHVLTIDTT
jgi:hypothetical protein